ncbi:SH3 domain-containing protein [Bacillus sp. FJAT-49732]|uniref:SH3 domain-containing protein n=1 Tax=Lederbergia citrisecunda TaxID=2833583 RepID=A0A942TLY7_9BACI|nr:SH3 domain-containing protein [Lederbergia citrisecunda]MBS4200625.1 SH3 domain-containing protein [Lederbergia citrisecunda]
MKWIGKLILSTVIILSLMNISLSPLINITVEAASNMQKIPKTIFQTTDSLNLRSGSGAKDRILLTIPKGKTVTATSKIGDKYKVSYTYKVKGKNVTNTGWVSGKYLKEYYKYTNTAKTYYETQKTTNLRSSADTKKKAVGKINKRNIVYSTQKVVNSLGQTWFRVSFSGKNYYVLSSDVKKVTLKTIIKTNYLAKNDTYLYSSYGNAYKKLVMIPKGSLISTKQQIGNWYKVTYNGKTGYIDIGNFTKYNVPTETKVGTETYTTKSKINLKQYAHNSSNTVTTIPLGIKVIPTYKTSNGWYKIKYNGKTGYVLSTYLQKIDNNKPNEEVSSEQKVAGIKLKVISNLNVRQKASSTSTILITIPKGTVVTPTHKTSENWYKVTYEGKTGYISGDYVEEIKKEDPPKVEPPKEEPSKEDPPKVETPTEKITEEKIPEKTFLIKENLNVRKTADSTSTILTNIPKGKIVIPTHKTSNNWYKVVYSGKTGYVSSAYLQEVKTGDPITTRTGYQFIDLRTQSPVTAAQINNYIAKGTVGKTSVLSGKGQVFIDSGKKYGVNPLFLAAHAIHESGYGTSLISLGKYNLFGFGAFDAAPYVGAYRFSSVNSNIDYIARELKSTYLNPSNWKYSGPYLGFSTKTLSNARIDANSEGMNFWYASDPNWGQKIASHMEKILPYNKAYYDTAKPDTTIPTRPSIPSGGDVFPNDILAIANTTLTLQSNKGGNDNVKEIKKGTSFTLLEKTNDYWVKVKVDGKVYWTNSIKFDAYKSYFSVQNLGRVNVSGLNIRTGAGTTHSIVGTLSQNEYVSILLKKDGTLTMDSSNAWYQISLPNGSKGWVSSQYITRELK